MLTAATAISANRSWSCGLELMFQMNPEHLIAHVLFDTSRHESKQHMGYEAHRSGGLQINFDHLDIFNVRQNLNTRAFLFFSSISKAATTAGI